MLSISTSQSIINQLFGQWHDYIGSYIGSVLFFYFAFGAIGLPQSTQKLMPAYIGNKRLCFVGGTVLASIALLGSHFSEAPPAANGPPIFSGPPIATADWQEINRNNVGDSISVDVPSISKKGGLVEYWSKVSFETPRIVGPSLTSSHFIDRYVANCEARTFSHRFSYSLSATGELRGYEIITAADQAFRPFPENGASPDAIALSFICKL